MTAEASSPTRVVGVVGVVLAAVLALLVQGAVTAAPARASVYDCPNTYACGWHGGAYDGTLWSAHGDWSTVPSAQNDKFSSISNRRATQITWYAESGYWGLAWTQQPGAAAQLGGGLWNDVISSIRSE